MVSGNAVVVDCPLSDTAILPIFIKPEPDGPRLELPNEFLQSSIEDQDLIIQGIKIIDVVLVLSRDTAFRPLESTGNFFGTQHAATGATMSGNGTKARFDRKDGTMNPHFRGNGGGLLNVAIVAKHGRIKLSRAVEQLSFVNDGSVGSSVLNFTGHIADINRALDKCVYSAKPHFNTHNKPPDEVSIIVSDLGETSSEKDVGVIHGTFYVAVTAVNDARVRVPARYFDHRLPRTPTTIRRANMSLRQTLESR